MPLLSIIIPVYNVEDYIDDCLNSILNQDFSDYEVILVDNASTDKSGHICEEYSERHDRIKTIHLDTNSLPAGARNEGLKHASGKYIHFCDSDDCLFENSFSKISALLLDEAPTVLVGQYISIPEKGAYMSNDVVLNESIFHQNNPISVVDHLYSLPNLLFTTWRFVVEREFLLANHITFPKGCHSEDEEWVPKVLCKADKFALLKEPFYCYRPRASGSITSSRSFINDKSKIMVAFNLLRFCDENRYEDVRKDLIYYRVLLLLGTFFTRCDTFTDENMKELAHIIEGNSDVLDYLYEIPERIEFYDIIKKYGAYKGIQAYCKQVKTETLSLIKGKEKSCIYIFPTGNSGEGTARMLQDSGYDVKGFFDNSKTKNNCLINGLKVSLPNIIDTMSPDEKVDLFIIISSQYEKAVQSIIKQLKSYGIGEKQYICRFY
ncbi:MAG: glycosyltransferase [Clostridiales bacterium]|nr:glycosyltransferase [Clostridiales bacterium]